MSKSTIKDQIKDLSEKVDDLDKKLDKNQTDDKLQHFETKIKTIETTFNDTLIDVKAELSNLKSDVASLKTIYTSEMENLKRELISYIILSNASKELDVTKLSETAKQLAFNKSSTVV